MNLTHVRVENFKRFSHLEVELKPLDCLVGPNNSGKTTLLQALALFDFCVHHCLSRKNGELEIKRRTIPPEGFYVLPVSDPLDLWTDRKAAAEEGPKSIQVHAAFDNSQKVTASIGLDYGRFAVSIESSDPSQQWLEHLAEYRIAYLPVFSAFLAQEERRTRAVVDDELARGRVHSVIRNLLLDLKEAGRHEEVIAVLRRTFPALEDMRIEFDEVSDRYISVTYREAGRPHELDVFSAGSGFQQFLYLFGFIHLRQPNLVLLDEPDKHLHGTLQNALLDEFRRLVQAGKQVLFATHSRDLIGGVSPENILSLEESGPKRLRVGFDVYDTLDRLGSMERTQLPIVQAFRRVLVVEDQTDWDLLSVFCAKCLGSPKWQETEKRLAVCYSKGNPYKQSIGKLREQLQQMISVEGRALEVFAVADRDYHPDPTLLEKSLERDHVRWHVWKRAEIENYLLCPDAIARILGSSRDSPVLWEAPFREEYSRLLESSHDRAQDQIISAIDYIRKQSKEGWDPSTMSRRAREYLNAHWNSDRLDLVDAKEIVLPGIKRWLQEHHLDQFSNKKLAESLSAEELPEEVHQLAHDLADFAGVGFPP